MYPHSEHLVNATRVYRAPSQPQSPYFIEKDGTLRAFDITGAEVHVPFTPSPGWSVWRVSKDGKMMAKKVLTV